MDNQHGHETNSNNAQRLLPVAIAHGQSSEKSPTSGIASIPAMFNPRNQEHVIARKKNLASCNLCRKRKTRCDRADPCSNCVRAAAICISTVPSRAPRGRQGGRRKVDSELLQRIAKLENLVRDIETGIGESPATASDGSDQPQQGPHANDGLLMPKSQNESSDTDSPKSGLNRYLATSLWVTLGDEITGLREVLDQSSDDETEPGPDNQDSSSKRPIQLNSSQFVIYGSNALVLGTDPPQHPTQSQVFTFCKVFLENVDPVLKMLHAPSLRRYLLEGSERLDCSTGPKGLDALRFAIYYAATTSLTAEECSKQIGEDKAVLLRRYRTGLEVALAKADFVNTEEMSTLQALVIFLVCFRSNDSSRLSWTLASLAIRIAQALGLHRESFFASLSPFQREMRRRLWWQMCILDLQASSDRGSDPILTFDSFDTKYPLHVNDDDLHPDNTQEPQERDEYTDMTFSLVCQEVFDTQRELNYVPARELQRSQLNPEDHWAQRRNRVIACQRRIEQRYLRHCNIAVPFQRITKMVAECIISIMWLVTYRPLQRHTVSNHSAQVPYPGVLHLSVEVMERSHTVSTDALVERYKWITRIYVQWHALAVMIAELCVQTEGPTVEKAWSIVDAVYGETAKHVADSNKGMLFRPIKKMYERAQAVRRDHTNSAATTITHLPGLGGFEDANATGAPAIAQLPTLGPDYHDLEMMDGALASMEGPHNGSLTTIPLSFQWDTWLVSNPSNQNQYNNEMNQMAWANWENFIDDFQRGQDTTTGADAALDPPFNLW